MAIILSEENKKEDRMMRDVYCSTLIDMAEEDNRIVVLDADLMKSLGMVSFWEAFPERTFNCGIQEANMIGIAAGLSATGKVPFTHTFCSFTTRRCLDQIFISAAYARLNMRIIGSDPGIAAAYNGGTHMSFEDMGIMRGIPKLTVIEPVDTVMLEDILRQVKDEYGVFYIRLMRKNAVKIYKEGSNFEIGKAIELKTGNDITLLTSGVLVAETLKAAEQLEGEGISCRVVNIFTLKPIDKEKIIECAEETGAIVTVENHNIINGLGSAVAEVLIENKLVPMERVGCEDEFGEVGPMEYLQQRYKMTALDIVKKSKRALSRK